jgi:hypothetical protein
VTFFYLERGNAQGDTTSPYIFNIGFQILLLKLTFDLQIEGLLEFPAVPDNTPPLHRTVGTYTRKVNAYADDANILTKLTYESLSRIKQILENFGEMSGLICNVEKTMLLPIGTEAPLDDRILRLGFSIVEEVTILGLKIDKRGSKAENLNTIMGKINTQINIWRPFNLSLPGRINIAKTMLYSQINYLGCFLPIPEEHIREYKSAIANFVKGKLNIAKKRLYLSPENGGLGLFEINNFLCAQKCAWVKRSMDLTETWKIILYVKNFGNLFNIKARNINCVEYPICYEISRCFERFSDMFTATAENFLNSYIFECRKFTLNLDNVNSLNRSYFSDAFYRTHSNKLSTLRYNNFYDEQGSMIDSETVCENTGLDLTELQLFRFRGICMTAKTRLKKKEIEQQKTLNIETFINCRKRGSSHIRKILMGEKHIGNTKNINKFANNMDIVITGEQSRALNTLWTKNRFSNQDRTFLFKFYNNTLGYNNAVAHFVPGHAPYCTFCEILRSPDANYETPVHLFFDCRSVSTVIDTVYCIITGNNDFRFSRREYFTTFDRREASCSINSTLTLISKIVIKYIWDCRNRQCIPSVDSCLETIKEKIMLQQQINANIGRIIAGSRLQFFTNIINDANEMGGRIF